MPAKDSREEYVYSAKEIFSMPAKGRYFSEKDCRNIPAFPGQEEHGEERFSGKETGRL